MTANTPAPPADLSEAARDKWAALAPALVERFPQPSGFHLDQLRVYVEAHALRQHALAELARERTALDTSPNGARFVSPWVKLARDCENAMDRVIRRLQLVVSRDGDDAPEIDLDND